jgi:hypothetical protein
LPLALESLYSMKQPAKGRLFQRTGCRSAFCTHVQPC